MSLVDDYRDIILDEAFGGAGGTTLSPSTWYMALSTTTPTETGTNVTEPSGGSYARKSVTNNDTNFPDGTGGVKTTGADITFVKSTASWGTATHFVFYDAATAGNVRAWGPFDESLVIGNNTTVTIPSGSITITLEKKAA